MPPNLREEKKLWKKGYNFVVGLDESGRGSLAGPVVAAAVGLKKSRIKNQKLKFKIQNLKDSKKLTSKQREKIYQFLKKYNLVKWGIGIVSEKVVDKINVKKAAELAMEKALKNLEKKAKKRVNFLIIDGNHLNSEKLKSKKYKLVIKADEKVFTCTLSSILAKVTRDRIMKKYSKKYPQYGFEKHKGYFTKLHFKMLKKYGPCKIHRKTFTPCKIKKSPKRS